MAAVTTTAVKRTFQQALEIARKRITTEPKTTVEKIVDLIVRDPESETASLFAALLKDQVRQAFNIECQKFLIQPGAPFPEAYVLEMRVVEGARKVFPMTIKEILNGKPGAVVCIPGTFSQTCEQKHVDELLKNPAFMKRYHLVVVAPDSPDNALAFKNFYGDLAKTASFVSGNGTGFFDEMGTLRESPPTRGLSLNSKRFVALSEDGETVSQTLLDEDASKTVNTCSLAILKAAPVQASSL